MKTRAAVLLEQGRPWEILELDLDDPGPGEVRVKMKVAGLCHSDKHVKVGGGARFPIVAGHEGAGVVDAVGDGVDSVAPGDNVAISWIPACGRCRWCNDGQSNLCDLGANMMTGELAAGGFRFHHEGQDLGGEGAVGTFSEYTVVNERSVVKIDDDTPLEHASLVSCGVTTGWGAVVNAGGARPGDAIAIYGCGGIGANAVRAAAALGPDLLVVIEPVEWKRDFAKQQGADLVFADAEQAQAEVWERTRGVGVDIAVVTTGVASAEVTGQAFALTRKGGKIVLVSTADDMMEDTVVLPGSLLTFFQKTVVGTLFGHCNPHSDVPKMLRMARDGKLNLDGLVTRRYSLDDVNKGFDDLLAGENIRGVIAFDN
ncbi:Zn-dependent alcohol dehydrogenase [Gordonia sp. KTR9]|uniref:Zn-dependent alcohol dehydrogenase n=1 Tax=Gordonia sp. KTR9 TaxID=337191 RepID=UPI00027DDF44|nr:Zn-dependent alcohol dehydrogenase [Gordonia sp. KTR9]AFR49484.1 Zn-dependent alcohol dehydrogenase, class III [Gordonia sp. KTR9]